jgi:protein SCO1
VIAKFCISFVCAVTRAGQTSALTRAELQEVAFEQHIGQPLSLNLTFCNSQYELVKLRDCLKGKPTLLVLGYFHCPMLCMVINDGLIEALQDLRLEVGKDFNVVNISIDPRETPSLAAAKKAEYLKRYGRAGAENGWHCLISSDTAAAQIATETGFRFRYDPVSRQFAHPSGFIVLTPEGTISRYFFGVKFNPTELRNALTAAARHQQGSVIRQLVLLCFHYNPITGKYGALIMNGVRAASIAAALALIALIAFLGSGSKRRAVPSGGTSQPEGGAPAAPGSQKLAPP